jgi:NADH-quinone oxidoreductase subunit J
MAINWHSCFFLLFALFACFAAVAVVLSNQVMRMAFWLIVSLASVGILFFLSGAQFVGAVQLMVYVGGTVVLLAFGMMLTGRGPFDSFEPLAGRWILATLIGCCLFAILVQSAMSVSDWGSPPIKKPALRPEQISSSGAIGIGLLGVRTDQLSEPDPVKREGMSGYILPFEIVSIHLLVVLLGAAFLARSRRERVKSPPEPQTQDEEIRS